MFEGRREKSIQFAGTMMGVVVVLNFVLILLDGTDFSENGRSFLYMFGPYIFGGILAIGAACYGCWQRVPVEHATRGDGARAGAIAVLLSYPLMGAIGGFVFAIGSIMLGDPYIGSAFLLSIMAVFTAFLLTAWVAVPLAMAIGGTMAPGRKQPDGIVRDAKNYPWSGQASEKVQSLALWKAVVFSSGMGVGALLVSGVILGLIFPDSGPQALRVEHPDRGSNSVAVLICGVSAFVSGMIVWPLAMGRNAQRNKAVPAGIGAASLTFPIFGLILFLLPSIWGVSASHTLSASIGASIFMAFLALIFAGLPAVIVGSVVGALSSKMIPE